MGTAGCRLIAAVALLCVALPAFAQIPGGALPGREREQFQQPPAPRAQPGGPVISLPSTVAPAGAESITLVLRDVTVEGATVYGRDQLAEFYRDLLGHPITLAAVYDIAKRITAKYGADGYVLSRAIVPPQQLPPHGATVRIQVVEGFISQGEWPAVLANYRDFFPITPAASSPTVRPMSAPSSVTCCWQATCRASNSRTAWPSDRHPGAATLVVEVEEKRIDAIARIDNRGSKARGPLEYFTGVTLNNPFGLHGLHAQLCGSVPDQELQYLNGIYRVVLTPEGLTAFVNASVSGGRPGSGAAASGLQDPQLLHRKRLGLPFHPPARAQLTLPVLGFASDDRSDILDTINTLDRLRGVRVRLDADAADPLNAINQLNLVFSQGIEGLGAGHGNGLASRINGRIDFNKFEATFTRMQPLFWRLSLLVSAYGQYAGTPLLSPELCGYGGRIFGRAYEPSQFVADRCLELLGELRLDVPQPFPDLTQAQLYAFADRGWLHNIAPGLPTAASVDGASVGGGLRLGWRSVVTADLSVAKAVAGPSDAWRFFLILTGRY
jgi:hemolysin activation/secretion protein